VTKEQQLFFKRKQKKTDAQPLFKKAQKINEVCGIIYSLNILIKFKIDLFWKDKINNVAFI